MAISRKPTASTKMVDVDKLINKGGTPPPSAAPDEGDRQVLVQLRLPSNLLRRIDGALSRRPIKTPRHTWFLEAIHDKLVSEDATAT